MPSIAEKVAYDVVENRGDSITAIALKHGASRAYATNGTLTSSKAYQRIIAKFREETTKQLTKKVKKSFNHLTDDKLSKSTAKDLMGIIDTGIKNVQLLTGGVTETQQPQPILQINQYNFNSVKNEAKTEEKVPKIE